MRKGKEKKSELDKGGVGVEVGVGWGASWSGCDKNSHLPRSGQQELFLRLKDEESLARSFSGTLGRACVCTCRMTPIWCFDFFYVFAILSGGGGGGGWVPFVAELQLLSGVIENRFVKLRRSFFCFYHKTGRRFPKFPDSLQFNDGSRG